MNRHKVVVSLRGESMINKHDLCRNRCVLFILANCDHNRSKNLCAATLLANFPVNGRRMKVFPLVTIKDFFRNLEQAEAMHPLLPIL